MDRYIDVDFSYVVFQMAMKRNRQGADSQSLLKLLHYDKFNDRRDVQTSLSTRIANGALITRHRYIFIVHRGNDGLFKNWGAVICPHFGTVCGKVIFLENSKVEYRMFHRSGGKDVEAGPGITKCDCCAHGGKDDVGTTRSGLMQCDYCATEFRIDSMAVGKRKEGRAFIITRWKGLGEGKSAKDPIWLTHVTEGVQVRTEFVPGSICAAFEGEGEVELSSLLTQRELKRLLKFRC